MASHFEQTQKGLETVLQSAEKGKKLFEDLRKFSFDTTFGVDELASASSQLLNVGVSTRALQKDLKMLGDLAQGDKNKFAELTSIFAKIQSTGTASSMQLQQLALRGIPINQMLKQIGVTGSATAEDIETAFEKMTSAGGQFNDAMQNINDTIEGKKGFISDTFKEILVNFGDVSGITESYKSALDTVYDIVDKINNKLMEWNENPVIKAIIQGVLITTVTGLIGLLVGGLIPALTTIVGLMGAINPAVWIGGLIGVGAGVTAGIVNAVKKEKELKASVITVNDELEKQRKLLATGTGYEAEDSFQRELLQSYENTKSNLETQLSDYKSLVEQYEKTIKDFANPKKGVSLSDYKQAQNQIDIVNEKILKTESAIKRATDAIEVQKQVVKNFDELNELSDMYKKLQNSYIDIVAKSDIGKNQKTLNDLEKNLKKVNDYKTLDGKKIDGKIFTFNDAQKKEIDDTVKYLQKEISNIKIKIVVDKQENWQKDLQKAFNFTDNDVYSGATKSTVGGLEYWEKKTETLTTKMASFNNILNEGRSQQGENIDKQIEQLTSAYTAIMNSEYYSGNEKSLDEYIAKIKVLKEERKKA